VLVDVGIDVVPEVVEPLAVEVLLVGVPLLALVLTVPVLPLVAALSVSFEESAAGELLQATAPISRNSSKRDSVLFIITAYHFLSCTPDDQRVSCNSKRVVLGQAPARAHQIARRRGCTNALGVPRAERQEQIDRVQICSLLKLKFSDPTAWGSSGRTPRSDRSCSRLDS